MYITKKGKNFKNLKIIKNVSTTHTACTVNISQISYFALNSFIVSLFVNDQGRLFHMIHPLKCTELRPRRSDLVGGKKYFGSLS